MSPGTGSEVCPGSRGGGEAVPPESPGRCAACGLEIVDRYYLSAVDRRWHVQCLRCHDCGRPLDSHASCFSKDGSIYCREDYYKRFASKSCSGCHQNIAAQELVMRARHLVYHLNCFTCAACHRTLMTGEHYGMTGDHIFCPIHYQVALQHQDNFKHDFSTETQLTNSHMFGASEPRTNPKGRPRKRKTAHLPEVDLCPGMMGGMGMGDGEYCDLDLAGLPDGCGAGYGSAKHKRMRTSFKHHQLRTMKSYFALNHNPDAKDLKELSQKTGLSKKVLQVWFQNARAKYRRNVLRQNQDKPTNGQMNSDENHDSKNSMSDFSQNSRSPGALSDISSSASLNDLPSLPRDLSRVMSRDQSRDLLQELSHDIHRNSDFTSQTSMI